MDERASKTMTGLRCSPPLQTEQAQNRQCAVLSAYLFVCHGAVITKTSYSAGVRIRQPQARAERTKKVEEFA